MPAQRDPRMQFAVAAASVLVFLYSLVILRQPLLGTAIALQLVFLYLVWRFVRAHERIADAKEGDRQPEPGSIES